MYLFKKIKRAIQNTTGPRLFNLRSPELTILGYHRIADPSSEDYYGFAGILSATAQSFALQLEFVRKYRNPIAISDLLAFLEHGKPLPDNAVLFTFDDGYADNFAAAEAMDQIGIKGIFFIPSGFVGGQKSFSWDFASQAILNSPHTGLIDIPLIGVCDLAGNRHKIINRLVKRLQNLSGSAEQQVLSKLAASLGVPEIAAAPKDIHMTWDQITTLHKNGHAIAPHTVNHPCMTAIPAETAIYELAQAKADIESRNVGPADCFAYPYGKKSDRSPEIESLLRDQKYKMAFTGFGGLSSGADLKRRPLAIQRVMISNCNSIDKFKTKLMWG